MLLDAEDGPTPGSRQSLMGGRGDPLGVRERGLMRPAGHQTGDVGHIDHQLRAHLVGDLPEGGEVDGPWICARTGHDELRSMLERLGTHFVHVDEPGGTVHPVVEESISTTREVDGHDRG